jgi:molecular chaperone Hsp33
VAVLLLSATIKFEGALILQAQTDGPIHTLVAQATHRRTVRGLARWHEDQPPTGSTLAHLYGKGHLVLTLQTEGTEPYQGVVGLGGNNLADAIQTYFSQSEQLPTRLWLAADGERAAGLFLQAMPDQQRSEDDWDRLTMLAATVTERELLHLPSEELLYRLFNEEEVMLFESEPVSFRCSCSRERIEGVLRSMAREELETCLQEGGIEVGCEFCNHRYHFDTIDIHALLSAIIPSPSSPSRH